MHSITFSLVTYPSPNVAISFYSFPNTVAILFTVNKFTIVNFTINPIINSFSVRFPIFVFTLKSITVGKQFVASTFSFIVDPVAFKYSTCVVDYNSSSMPFSLKNFASVD
jgi:hypothetical protein